MKPGSRCARSKRSWFSGRLEPKREVQLLRPRNLYLSAFSVVRAEQLVCAGQEPLIPGTIHNVQEIDTDGKPPTSGKSKPSTKAKIQVMRRWQLKLPIVSSGTSE